MSRTPHPQKRGRAYWTVPAVLLALALSLAACTSTPPPSGDLPAPSGVWLQEHDGAITVHWDAVQDSRASGYEVLSASTGAASLAVAATVSGRSTTQHELTGLTNGQAYQLALRAVGEGSLRSERSPVVLGAPFTTSTTALVDIVADADGGTAVLDDGRRFQLITGADLTYDEGASSLTGAGLVPAGGIRLRPAALPPVDTLPDSFSMAAYQTGIRNQGGRGTCQTFAAIAAVEAAYRHAGQGTFNLSEQYASHITRITDLNKTPGSTAVVHENQLGVIGGWNSRVVLHRMEFYGVPGESDDPYISSGNYAKTNQTGDVPRINRKDATVSQRVYDDFNLQDEATTYQIPASLTTTPLPRDALTDAPYGVTGYHEAPASRLYDPTWYEQTLYSGQEIAFAFCFHGGGSDADGIWRVGNQQGCGGGHQVLLIGYDRTDPNDPVFIAKNSWGGSSFQKLEYGFVTDKNGGKQAVVVDGVRDPNRTGPRPQLALGRWDLVADGTSGLLDINRLSGYYKASRLSGQTDRRLGAFFDPSNAAHRVNGSVDAATLTLDFRIDFANPALDFETLTGDHFTGTIARPDPTFLAGTYVPAGGGGTRGFYARKDGPFASVPGGTTMDPATFEGRWRVHGLGVDTVLVIDSVLSTGAFTAHATHDPGTAVTGLIDLATREVSFTMADGGGISGDFRGSVHQGDLGTISGSYQRGSNPGGLALIREGDVPSVTIDSVGTLRENGSLTVRASVHDFVAPADVTIEWSYQTTAGGASTSMGTSTSGQDLTTTVPCDDLILRARGVDASRGLEAEDVATVSCQPQFETRSFHIDRDLSGWVNDNGKFGTAAQGSVLYAGDDALDHAYRSMLTFPFNLPAGLVAITKAEVTVDLQTVEGDPYSGLLDLRAYQVDYGAGLDAGDFTPSYLPGAATLPFDGTTTFGALKFDMTTAVQDAWSNRATRGDQVQLALQFRTATDSDGVADRATFEAQDQPGTTLLPFVDITFQNY